MVAGTEIVSGSSVNGVLVSYAIHGIEVIECRMNWRIISAEEMTIRKCRFICRGLKSVQFVYAVMQAVILQRLRSLHSR